MANSKQTISRDSVFRSMEPATSSLHRQGITPMETPTRQTAVWLSDEEVQWLDSRCQEIRQGGWRSITRSALIRGLIRAAMRARPDLTGVSGEADLTQRLGSHP